MVSVYSGASQTGGSQPTSPGKCCRWPFKGWGRQWCGPQDLASAENERGFFNLQDWVLTSRRCGEHHRCLCRIPQASRKVKIAIGIHWITPRTSHRWLLRYVFHPLHQLTFISGYAFPCPCVCGCSRLSSVGLEARGSGCFWSTVYDGHKTCTTARGLDQ